MSGPMQVVPVTGLPEVRSGDRLGEFITVALRAAGHELTAGDVLVVSQKIVSKAEGRTIDLAEIEPTSRAIELGKRLEKDPRLVEAILRESRSIIRADRRALIVETRSGLVCANAGIDASNVPGADRVTALPKDPDASARRIRRELRTAAGVAPAVVVADSFGRPWRLGQAEVAIGCAGVVPIDDWRGRTDRDEGPLTATAVAVVDQLAGAADLARAKDEGVPVCLVRGLERFVIAEDGPGAASLRRPEREDLFR
jgi:coenzyme F420-0:L-glutamate ligase / coenzyme F420-1:gamma-L-glutamate ligase